MGPDPVFKMVPAMVPYVVQCIVILGGILGTMFGTIYGCSNLWGLQLNTNVDDVPHMVWNVGSDTVLNMVANVTPNMTSCLARY